MRLKLVEERWKLNGAAVGIGGGNLGSSISVIAKVLGEKNG